MEIKRKSAEHVAGNISQSESGNVVHLCGCVQRKKTLHSHLILFDTESMSNTFWKILEDLSR